MVYYISDIHFGHKASILFDHRPYETVEEMDRALIDNWNSRVRDDDHVYILGDFCYRSGNAPDTYLKQLKGHKHLIVGNHDRVTLDNPRAMQYFESVDKIGHVNDNGREVVLCHFPMAEWYKSRHGSWHIYGHIHNRKEDTYMSMKKLDHALNAAAAINYYTPATFEELIVNNKAFQAEDEPEPVMVVLTNKHTGNSFKFNMSEMNNLKIDKDTIILETEEGSNIALGGENGMVINPSYSIRPMTSLDEGLPLLRVIGKRLR